MQRTQNLDIMNFPLQGINLLEASAGTGKTYAIACIVVRMIAENDFPIDNILIVTFTKLATNELKTNIREKLLQVRIALNAKGLTDDGVTDEFAKNFCEKHRNSKEKILIIKRLNNAINDFDKAMICTIHSFCQQMLQENAFESGELFELKAISNQNSFIEEIVNDFWRNNFYEISPEFAFYITGQKVTPASLIKMVKSIN
ncbi:MAG: UvrD-helicase domain-containing protein, partial [Deltaproteobacteria bacterium]